MKNKRMSFKLEKFDTRDLGKDKGHEFGAGRATVALGDKRRKRKRTRSASNRAAIRDSIHDFS